MARAKSGRKERLEDALAALTRALTTLLQTQAILLQTQIAFLGQVSRMEWRQIDTNRSNHERFTHIEERLERIEAQLHLHHRTLQAFLDSMRGKSDARAPHPDRSAGGPDEPPPFHLVPRRPPPSDSDVSGRMHLSSPCCLR